MTTKLKFWFFIYVLLAAPFSFAQYDDSQKIKTLDEKIIDNNELMMTNPEKAFEEIDLLMDGAVISQDHNAELNLMSRKIWYYVRKSEFDHAIDAVQKMEAKAKQYGIKYWQAIAHQHLIEIYAASEIPEKAIAEFEITMKLLNDSDKSEQTLNYARALSHIKIANVYESKKDYPKLIHTLKQADKYINLLKKEKVRTNFLYINYTNLGAAYLETKNYDSSFYFVNKSLKLASNGENHLMQFRNYFILGVVFNKKNKNKEAIYYLRKAENIGQFQAVNSEEKEMLYSNLASAYEVNGNKDSLLFYTQRWKDSQIEVEKSKNKSLHKIIDKDLLKEENYTVYVVAASAILLLLLIVLLLRSRRINSILKQQEKISQQYLQDVKSSEQSQLPTGENFAGLIEMAKNNDQSFLVSFHKSFPDFTKKILSINPKIAQTEIEFMALIRMNLSTKEISQIQSIQPKTVQNKKRRIRQRLNIPSETDIYFFFNQL